MESYSVNSSNVARIGYENGTLTVLFHSGGVYEYYNVPERVFRDFLTASSVGSYLHQNIIGRYRERRIR